MQEEYSFCVFCIQFEFGFWNENVLHVLAKMRIFKTGRGGVHYSNGCPACTVEQVVNIFTVIVNGTSAYSEMQKE